MQPLPGFKHFTSHHCVTGSLRHIYEFYGYPISEEMLLGLGAGFSVICTLASWKRLPGCAVSPD